MAALTAANQARIAQNTGRPALSGGTSSGSYVGYSPDLLNSNSLPANFQMPNNNYGIPQHPPNNSFLDSSSNTMHSQSQSTSPLKQRQTGFLNGIANLMVKRGTPLPPSLTGVPVPNYDPTNSIWTIIEPSEEVGAFKLAGKDVDLFKLWGLVFQHGGAPAVRFSFSGSFQLASSFVYRSPHQALGVRYYATLTSQNTFQSRKPTTQPPWLSCSPNTTMPFSIRSKKYTRKTSRNSRRKLSWLSKDKGVCQVNNSQLHRMSIVLLLVCLTCLSKECALPMPMG